MAFEPGRGRTAVPVRSALAGTTVAVAAVVAALVFGTSLIALVGTPHRYGQNWAQELDLEFGGRAGRVRREGPVRGRRPSRGYAAGDYGQLTVNGEIVRRDRHRPGPRAGLPHAAGRPGPGRPRTRSCSAPRPCAPSTASWDRPCRLSSTVVNPRPFTADAAPCASSAWPCSRRSAGAPSQRTDLGTGAAVPASLLSEPFPQASCAVRSTCYNFFLVRYRPGTDLPPRRHG